jgi:hypothetical protein
MPTNTYTTRIGLHDYQVCLIPREQMTRMWHLDLEQATIKVSSAAMVTDLVDALDEATRHECPEPVRKQKLSTLPRVG